MQKPQQQGRRDSRADRDKGGGGFFANIFGGGKKGKSRDPTGAGEELPFSVSSPYNVKHQIHVDFNSATGFSGLPKEWESMLQGNISKAEVLENPDAVLDDSSFRVPR